MPTHVLFVDPIVMLIKEPERRVHEPQKMGCLLAGKMEREGRS